MAEMSSSKDTEGSTAAAPGTALQGRREGRSQLQHMDKAVFPGPPPSFWLTAFWQLSGSFHGREVVPQPRKHLGMASH